jgi:AcrR family transcriptional regulator
MGAKTSLTRNAFVEAAFKIVREKGLEKLSARSLAKELHCSTMPIYSYLKSMKSLHKQLGKKATDLLLTYQTTPRTGRVFFDMGLGYILFARQEKNLFRLLFARNEGGGNSRVKKTMTEFALKSLVQEMKNDPIFQSLNERQLENILIKMWIFVHGLAFLMNNNAFPNGNEDYIKEIIGETGQFIIEGEKEERLGKEGK